MKTIRLVKKKAFTRTLLFLRTSRMNLDHDKVNSLREAAHSAARSSKADARHILEGTESILGVHNRHCRTLRAKYHALKETVDGLPVYNTDFRHTNQTLRLIRSSTEDYSSKVKSLKKDFDKYYYELLKTCVKRLEEDYREAKPGGPFQSMDLKVFIHRVKGHVENLKKYLKKEKGFEPFGMFWASFKKALDEVKRLEKVSKTGGEPKRSRAEEYLGLKPDLPFADL